MQLTLVTFGALCSAVAINASPFYQHSTLNVRKIAQRDIAGYDTLGCYTEATTRRALSDKSYFDDQLTLELCQTACQGYNYFGVEYGREVCNKTRELYYNLKYPNISSVIVATI